MTWQVWLVMVRGEGGFPTETSFMTKQEAKEQVIIKARETSIGSETTKFLAVDTSKDIPSQIERAQRRWANDGR